MDQGIEVLKTLGYTALGSALVLGAIYLKFGRGLATRLQLHIMPVAATAALAATFSIRLEDLPVVNYGLVIPFSIFVTVYMLLRLHRVVVKELSKQVSELNVNQSQLAATAQRTASTAAEQASAVAQVTTTVEEIRQTSAAAAETAQEVMKASSEAVEAGQRGLRAAQRAASVMNDIAQVRDVVEAVKQLAEQSNLLAVNASIEAAKAGDHGRGFAVVATEVRSLASQSKSAAARIRTALEATEEGKRAADTAHEALQQLAEVLDHNALRARQISGAVVQQSTGIGQIGDAMASVEQGGNDTAEASRELIHAADNLKSLGGSLDTFITGKAQRTEPTGRAAGPD